MKREKIISTTGLIQRKVAYSIIAFIAVVGTNNVTAEHQLVEPQEVQVTVRAGQPLTSGSAFRSLSDGDHIRVRKVEALFECLGSSSRKNPEVVVNCGLGYDM